MRGIHLHFANKSFATSESVFYDKVVKFVVAPCAGASHAHTRCA